MQLNSDDFKYVFSSKNDLEHVYKIAPYKPFSSDVCSFLNAVSQYLLKDMTAKKFPDVITFAFWCRKSNIDLMSKKYNTSYRIGRGVIFHIAPSNVPVNFAFSLVAGLLSGNVNIVRIPTKEFEQVKIICDAFEYMIKKPEYSHLSDYVIFLRYERNDVINKFLSSLCDVRIIWGGDNAINDIRKSQLSPKAFDVTFTDRYSLSMIHAYKYLSEGNADKIAQDFYNDTFLFDQNACTAPHLVVWVGQEDEIDLAKKKFWDVLHSLVVRQYDMKPVQAVDKLTSFYLSSAYINERLVEMPDNYIVRIELSELINGIEDFRCQGGYFYEYSAKTIKELIRIVNRKFQTLSYYGFEASEVTSILDTGLAGIDRIVPIGKTMDFSLNWDGYDLITTLSRGIEVW